ncbi:MAG: transcription antiterminator LicT, partial [Erysipelotrichaceae bacterium]|nr:transcription antiterminator LicT [Erysipelotrichaceae bacterium]
MMKVIRNINNNIAHCLDSKGREVIVFGKGIGFYKKDEEIPLNEINRTFYNIKDTD